LVKSTNCKELHPENISAILVAFEAIKFDKLIDFKELKYKNVLEKEVIDEASKCEKSNDSNEVQ
jgi:hypothetical protein